MPTTCILSRQCTKFQANLSSSYSDKITRRQHMRKKSCFWEDSHFILQKPRLQWQESHKTCFMKQFYFGSMYMNDKLNNFYTWKRQNRKHRASSIKKHLTYFVSVQWKAKLYTLCWIVRDKHKIWFCNWDLLNSVMQRCLIFTTNKHCDTVGVNVTTSNRRWRSWCPTVLLAWSLARQATSSDRSKKRVARMCRCHRKPRTWTYLNAVSL